MKNRIILLLIAFSLFGCQIKEHPINKTQAFGRYKRTYYQTSEYLCLNEDMSYTYAIVENNKTVVKTVNEWEFDQDHRESRIFLKKFDYTIEFNRYSKQPTGLSAPISFSEAKNSVVLRMDPDDHFQDFIRVDNASCH